MFGPAVLGAIAAVVSPSPARASRPPDQAPLDIILYGAYGCVGHLAALHLAKQQNLTWAIAGRNASKLHALAATLADTHGASSHPEIIVASLVGDLPWVKRAKAVATAAGPFSIHDGENLVKACATYGVSYSDTSDEFYWQRRMITGYDVTARATGARIALASGFCAVAADLGAALALERADGRNGRDGATTNLDAWLEKYSGGISAGVIHTTHVNASYPKEWSTDPYVLAPTIDPSLKIDTLVDGTHYPLVDPDHEGFTVPNLFGDYDARFMRRSFAARGQRVHLRVGSPITLYPDWINFLLRHPGSCASAGLDPPTSGRPIHAAHLASSP